MLTTVTTFVRLTPLLLERSVQAQFLIPMATSLAFGVLVPAVITRSSRVTFRYSTDPLLEKWDRLRALARDSTLAQPTQMLPLRTLLREAGFTRAQASGLLTTESGLPAGLLEDTRPVAHTSLIRLRGVLGSLALEQGWGTKEELGVRPGGRA